MVRGLKTLREAQKKAKDIMEEKAKLVYQKKDWGTLIDYNAYQKAQPAKPQLIKAVDLAITKVEKRATEILAANKALFDKWGPAEDMFRDELYAALES